MDELPAYLHHSMSTITTLEGFQYVLGWRVSVRDLDGSLGNGEFHARDANGNVVGRLWVNGNMIEDVEVKEAFRRRGAASAMLTIARYLLGEVRHNWDDMTDDGQAWADEVG
jgi:hypothetical protein